MPSNIASQRNSKIQNLATGVLVSKHMERYRELYQRERKLGSKRNSCQSRARRQLTYEFHDEYRELYLSIKKDFVD